MALLGLQAIQVVLPQDNGLFALGQIFIPHLTVMALLLLPLASRRRAHRLRISLLALGLVFLLRFGGEWLSLPALPDGNESLHVVTWNLEVGSRAGEDAVAALRARPADVVALQELTPEVALAIEADPELLARYPYRALDAVDGTAGMGLLSRSPIVERAYVGQPFRQEVTVDIDGRRVFVINGHPYPARLALSRLDIDTTTRNAELDVVRKRATQSITAGVTTLVVGDFNTASTEPAFGRFTSGFTDAHVEVGLGPGWTWRPSRLEGFGIGLLRIDVILGGPGVVPISVGMDCSRVGDHCLLEARVRIR